MEEEDEEAGPERQQQGRGAAAMEEGDEEAGPERQRLGRGAAAGLGSQRPLEIGAGEAAASGKRGRRGSDGAGELAAWPGSSE